MTDGRRKKPVGDRLDIGTVESVRIEVLSETGWFDDTRFKQDMADYGGPGQSAVLDRVAVCSIDTGKSNAAAGVVTTPDQATTVQPFV